MNLRFAHIFVLQGVCGASVLALFATAGNAAEKRPDAKNYRSEVQTFFAKYCIDCHGDEKPAGKLNLKPLKPDFTSAEGLETWRMIDERMRFGEMPPKDADQPSAETRRAILGGIRGEFLKTQQPGAVIDDRLSQPQFGNYVDHRALFEKRRPHVTPAPPRLWRLRPAIYQSVTQKLGEKITGLANALNRDDGSEFKDFAAGYFLDESSTQQLFGNAKTIAAAQLSTRSKDRVFRKLVGEMAPQSKAVAEAIETAFRKALGREPTRTETQRFLGLYNRAKKIAGHRSAAKALLTAVVMQPEFVFRQELAEGKADKYGRVRLSPRETAFALSYALGNQPLREFVAAAANGKLSTNVQVGEVVRKRLKDDSILYNKNPRLVQFFREYFHYPNANEVFKDQPEGGEHKAATLIADLELTIREILKRDKQVLAELLTTNRYYVNAGYGRKRAADKIIKRDKKTTKYQTAFSLPLDWKWSPHLQPVAFRRDERAGVLTHPAWLAAWSGNFDNHPVQRGKWIRTHLLGSAVPDVPIGVDARVPEKPHTTFRNRLLSVTRKVECRRCHNKMDDLGLVFERYDHYGRVQRRDAGQPVVTSGVITRTGIPSLDGRKVNGPTELMQVLATSEHVEQVFVRYAFRFFMGRNETLGDANTLQDAYTAYRKNNGSFNALVVSLLSSDSFLMRQKKPGSRKIERPSNDKSKGIKR